jgi:hypothetical protein
MQSGDSSYSLAGYGYATMFAVRGSSASPQVDVFTDSSAVLSAVTTVTCPNATPTGSNDMAFMIWVNGNGAQAAPAPTLTNLITYNLSGGNPCGMAISYETLVGTGLVSGDSCGCPVASDGAAQVAATLLIK